MAKNDWRGRIYLNKKAFDAVIGTKDEPGAYVKARVRNSTQAMLYGSEGEAGTANPTSPSKADFCCDVEAAVEKALEGRNLLKKFLRHYIIGKESFTPQQASRIEQLVGAQLRRRGIYPIGRYFTTIRKKINSKESK